MKENQTPKTAAKPPLPTTNSPKRLLSRSNPNNNEPPAKTTPFPPQFPKKKTRDLPNLSDCHACGTRINYTNPQDRLRALDSAWRIVLLCKVCVSRVEKAQICMYCFGSVVSGFDTDCFRCDDCGRFVHKDCVFRYKGSPPWSYCHGGYDDDLEFSVCVDCWVPGLLVNSVCGSGRRRGKKKKNVGESRGLNKSSNERDLGKDWGLVVDKKVVNKGKEDGLRTVVVAKKVVAVENGVDDGGEGKCLDDVELALRLHRAMNSSPRISRSSRSGNYSCLGGARKKDSSFFGMLCVDRQLDESRGGTVTESLGFHSSKADLEGEGCQGSDENYMAGGVEKGSSADGKTVLRYYERRCKVKQELQLEETITQGSGNTSMMVYSRRNRKPDRYLLKYTRRLVSSEAASNDYVSFCSQMSAFSLPICSNELETSPSQSCDVTPLAFTCESASSHEEASNKRLLRGLGKTLAKGEF